MKYYSLQTPGRLSGSNLTFMIRMPFSATMSKPTFVNAESKKSSFPFCFQKRLYCPLCYLLYITFTLLRQILWFYAESEVKSITKAKTNMGMLGDMR